jgi:hypothetical protein
LFFSAVQVFEFVNIEVFQTFKFHNESKSLPPSTLDVQNGGKRRFAFLLFCNFASIGDADLLNSEKPSLRGRVRGLVQDSSIGDSFSQCQKGIKRGSVTPHRTELLLSDGSCFGIHIRNRDSNQMPGRPSKKSQRANSPEIRQSVQFERRARN